MAKQAMAAHTVLWFDAIRVPFCQTIEAEALGCKIKPGGPKGIPGIEDPPPYKLDDTPVFPDDFLSRGRIPELLKAVRIMKKELGDEVAEKAGTALAKALTDAGADIISCEDMTASPEMIAPKTYRDFELEYQSKQFEAISVPKILHICGNADSIAEWMGQTGAEILSLEPKASARLAWAMECPRHTPTGTEKNGAPSSGRCHPGQKPGRCYGACTIQRWCCQDPAPSQAIDLMVGVDNRFKSGGRN
jgi:[methyl-Co(III) methanol-specific corrinoid protein]:coenzyme M methyltransferase